MVTPKTAAQADYKTLLQEKLQAERRAAPRYSVVEALGPPHKRTFHVEVSWDGGNVRAEGRSRGVTRIHRHLINLLLMVLGLAWVGLGTFNLVQGLNDLL